ncbi:uncharacterized protein I303_106000 [Kwoniella dejecticola CBS 10117]|uniref:Uncharacterized protein n=1 Tax=Kwoniella dejecticola CBS 10117 TaxID=1296121 RepID=A0A1A6A107_9TREE|nr:uncharacterized protein I303_06020 [Kwoniella dejecticola CBS 10117]OBR83740.1 hypothetical protein I303_06020 [Kwoniella dejecticola CBS 10117]
MPDDTRQSLPRTETGSSKNEQYLGQAKGSTNESTSLVDAHVNPFSSGMLRLYGVWSVALLATFMAGYGVSSMTAINSMTYYQDYFSFADVGVSTGVCLRQSASGDQFEY